jgi:Putative DNA-binding domain
MSKPSLKDIQQSFQALLLTPSNHAPEWIISDQLSAADRLAIYSEGYRLRLCETLTNDFPAIAFLIGDDIFKQWCLTYIDAHQSTHFSLRYFGKHFSAFLETRGEPLYSQLASFEWALTDAFDARDHASLTKETLAQLPIEAWETLTFTLHPSVQLLTLYSNAPSVWQAFKNKGDKELLISVNESTVWLIWRQTLNLFFRPLTHTEHQALLIIRRGGSWQEICDALAIIDESSAPQVAANFLNRWVTDYLLSAAP